jgi:hypothetical protein
MLLASVILPTACCSLPRQVGVTLFDRSTCLYKTAKFVITYTPSSPGQIESNSF